MKITKIQGGNCSYSVCDDLLEKGYYSDSVFDKAFIEVTIDIGDNWMAPIYRKYWEDVFIKIDGSETHLNDDNEFVLYITISEALGFIYKATPPRFQHNIAASHKSIDDIIKSLETFLLGDESYISFVSMFFEYVHMTEPQTQWQNFERLKAGADLIRDRKPKELAYGYYIYASTHDIDTLAMGKDMAGMGSSNTMICCKLDKSYSKELISFSKDILNIQNEYDESINVKVDNVKCVGNDAYVSLNITVDLSKGGWDYMPTQFAYIIKRSYENVK